MRIMAKIKSSILPTPHPTSLSTPSRDWGFREDIEPVTKSC